MEFAAEDAGGILLAISLCDRPSGPCLRAHRAFFETDQTAPVFAGCFLFAVSVPVLRTEFRAPYRPPEAKFTFLIRLGPSFSLIRWWPSRTRRRAVRSIEVAVESGRIPSDNVSRALFLRMDLPSRIRSPLFQQPQVRRKTRRATPGANPAQAPADDEVLPVDRGVGCCSHGDGNRRMGGPVLISGAFFRREPIRWRWMPMWRRLTGTWRSMPCRI